MASSEVPTGALVVIMNDDMSSAGANSPPMNGTRRKLAASTTNAVTKVMILCRSTQSNERE